MSRQTCLGTPNTSLVRVWVEECDQADDNVGGTEQRALEVVAAPVKHQEVGDERRHEKADGLEEREIQRHLPVHDPPEDDYEGRDEERDLDRAANRDADAQVHLVLHGNRDRGDVLRRVADDGEDDKPDEDLADGAGRYEAVDRLDHEVSANRHQAGRYE